jgi:hypothetical protein
MRQRSEPTVTPRERHASSLLKKVQDIHYAIARQARNLFAFRGFRHSDDRADWVQAESEFIHRVPVEILNRLREWER